MRLKEIRTLRRLKQQQVADLLEIPLRTYQNYERGINEPDAEILIKLANYFGTTIDYLVGYSDVIFSPNSLDIAKDEFELLSAFRQLDDIDKATVTRVVNALLNTAIDGGTQR